jgi:hypothetical protein
LWGTPSGGVVLGHELPAWKAGATKANAEAYSGVFS